MYESPENECGSCYGCCKALAIDDLGDAIKPANELCSNYCKGAGCTIYDRRPKSCSDYDCLWLVAKHRGQDVAPELRPDQCGIVFDGIGDQEYQGFRVVTARLLWPEADQEPNGHIAITLVAQAQVVIVSDAKNVLRAAVPAVLGSDPVRVSSLEAKQLSIPLEKEDHLHG